MPIKHYENKDVVILSYSAYSVYKQCPKRYYREKIARESLVEEDRSFTIPGLVVHMASESYLKEGAEYAFVKGNLEDNLNKMAADPQVNLEAAYGSYDKAFNFTLTCADNLNRFLLANNIRNKKFLTEAWFGTWEDPLFLSSNLATQGAPDLIVVNDNGSAILYDYKATWSTKNLNKDQLLLYSIASELKFGLPISMASFFLLPANKHEYFRFTQVDKDKLISGMQKAADDILSLGENLPETPNERCDRCPFYNSCSKGKDYKVVEKKESLKMDFNNTSFGAEL